MNQTNPTFNISIPAPQETTIADTCMLAVYTAHKISTTRRADKQTEQRIRREENDESITVNKHLFKKGPVRELLQLMDKAYDEHIALTAPWVDKGPRILPGERFQAYERAMNSHKEAVAQARRPVLDEWDTLVYQDISMRSQAGQKGVDLNQYPSRGQIRHRTFTIEWRVDPIARDNDFRVEVPEYIKQQRRDYVQSAVEIVRADLLKRMLDPIQKAAERLSVPIGEAGSVFRDTLVENMRGALEQAKMLNVGGDPDVSDVIIQLEAVLSVTGPADSLRTQQQHRERTAEKLAVLSKQFAGMV